MTALRALAAAALACAAAAARAQPYDPDFRWRTLETPHFRVTFHQGEDALAQEVAREAERAHLLLVPRLGFEPRQRTEVVLSDDSDDANGSATPLPYDTVRLYAAPPSSGSVLENYRDWVRQLVQHEYTHILHLDHVGGVPAVFNAIFGKLWIPNGLVPSFFIEGLAVVNESEGDRSGRNASALFDMYARALALDGPFPRLDQAANPYLEWPVGNVPYLLGGRFMGFLEARYGTAAVAGWIRDQGRYVWPYAPSWAGRTWFGGLGFPELWSEYASMERAYAEGQRARVRERPVTEPARLTRRGGAVANPRFSPDGKFIAYYARTLDDDPGVYRVTPGGKELGLVTIVDANGTLAVRSPREALVAISEVWHEYRVYDDLYLVDLESGRRRRVTDGERATDPDVSPDGRTAVYVRRTGAGEMALVRRDLAGGGAPEVLFSRPGAQVFMPRLARDGRVAFELHEAGRRDIALWHDGAVDRVTDDDALDTSPAWTPDGRFLLFASDRGGVYNVYAWEGATGRIRQVTNVELGALQPDVSPDGKTLAFVTYSRAGYDLATLPLDEAAWLDPTAAPPPVPPPAPAEAPSEPYEVHPYRAWPTIRPTLWLPFVAPGARGTEVGAFTAGADVLLRHLWTLQAWWDTSGPEPGYAFSYLGGWSWPRLDLSSSVGVQGSPGPPDRLQRVWTYADAGLTFTWTRLARQLALRVGWSGTSYTSIEPIPPESLPPEIRFQDGFLSEASIAAAYSDARRFVHSISPEEGRVATLSLGLSGPSLGSDFELARARAAIAQYLRIPFTRHDVLAVRLAGGVAQGSIGGNAPFELGGVAGTSLASLLPGAFPTTPDQLRGYPPGALGGTGYVLGNAEVRLPLFDPYRGRSTWPVFLSRLHATAFLDVGDCFDLPGELPFAGHPLDASELRFSTGAELIADVALGYYVFTQLRVGVAFPLGALLGSGHAADRAIGIGDSPQFYVTVGPAF